MGDGGMEAEDDGHNLHISKSMTFDSLDDQKHFLGDYSVKHHRPFNVVHSNKKKRYTVKCQRGCAWKVWARSIVSDANRWRITRIEGPYTCGTAEASKVHSQCTARYIVSTVYTDPEISVKALIPIITGFTNYEVLYGKAWRAKQIAIATMWGDWKEAYGRVPRILSAMSYFNEGVKWCTMVTDRTELHNGVQKHQLKHVFWAR